LTGCAIGRLREGRAQVIDERAEGKYHSPHGGYSGPRKLDHLLSYRMDQERGIEWQVSGRVTRRL
jgi:hypothetical protein